MQQPAPPYEGLEAVREASGLEVATAAQYPKYYYSGPHNGEAALPPAPRSRICGLSKPIFWLAAAMTVLFLGMVALGVGLGVSLSKAQTANAAGKLQWRRKS
jgi:hypothetical protein